MQLTYLQRRQTEITLLKTALDIASVEPFNSLGHKILGTARSYGFESLEPIAFKMQQLPLNALKAEGPPLVEEFSKWVFAQIENCDLNL